MSSLSDHPYTKILSYWSKRVGTRWYALPFLATKVIEMLSFNGVDEIDEKTSESSVKIKKSNLKHSIQHGCEVFVVIPAYIQDKKDEKFLKRLVGRLDIQKYPVQVIVVDDHSPFKYSLPKNVERVRLKKNNGPAHARNIGMNIAVKEGADIISFTDVDCLPNKDWSEKIVDGFVNDRYCHIISGITYSLDKNWLGMYHNINGTLNGRKFKKSDLLLYGPTCNLSVIREVAKSLRFDTDFPNAAGEDIHFCFNAIHKGFNIKHRKDVIIYHDFDYRRHPSLNNILSFKRQFQRYAKGEKILIEKIPDYYSYLDLTNEIDSMLDKC